MKKAHKLIMERVLGMLDMKQKDLDKLTRDEVRGYINDVTELNASAKLDKSAQEDLLMVVDILTKLNERVEKEERKVASTKPVPKAPGRKPNPAPTPAPAPEDGKATIKRGGTKKAEEKPAPVTPKLLQGNDVADILPPTKYFVETEDGGEMVKFLVIYKSDKLVILLDKNGDTVTLPTTQFNKNQLAQGKNKWELSIYQGA